MREFKRIKKILLVLFIFSISLRFNVVPVLAQTRPLTQQQIIELSSPAVVFVEYFYKGYVFYKGQKFGSIKDPGQPFFESFLSTVKAGPFEEGRGSSGFIVHPDGYILTAGHCVQDYPAEGNMLILQAFLRDYIIPNFIQQAGRPPDEKELQNLFKKIISEGAQVIDLTKEIYVRTGNWSAYKADVLVVSEFKTGKDVAIIKIPGKNFPTLPLGNSDSVKEGDEILAIGYPGILQDGTGQALSLVSLLTPTVTKGIVSALRVDASGSPMIQIDAVISGGNSGGPLVNNKGEAIGVASWMLGQVAHKEGGSYGMFVPINQAKVFVNQAGFTPQRGLTDEVYYRALDFYWQGQVEKALEEFKKVMEFYPRHPTGQRYILECTEKLAKGEAGRRLSLPSWLLILIIVVAVALILIFVLPGALKKKPPLAGKRKDFGYLMGQEGPLAGNRFPIEKDGLIIGRDPAKCQVVLSDDIVSREHALIEPTTDGKSVKIKNLSGTNPTYVNDRAITEAQLKDGDIIKVGRSLFLYKTG